jgi:eukaryotic-like serine/threonine-protein kinase
MSAVDANTNLLFGLLALQNGLIDQDQLIAAFRAWSRDKDRQIAEYLVDRDNLDADQCKVVHALVGFHAQKHGGSTEKSLASISAGRSTRERLAELGDDDIEGTLAYVGTDRASSQCDADADRTATYSVGTASSDGQRFRVLRLHARGGLGAVFVALDEELHREVALKQILDAHADDPVSRQRFLLEAEITGGLEHPGIVPVYGLGTYAGGRPYYAMRFIKGDSLKEAIERFHEDEACKADPGRRSLESRKLLRRFTDVCNAIDYAHSRGVLHRDIKPGNIIVGKHGETLVVDWGLAKTLGRIEPGQESGERTLVPSSTSAPAETLPGSALGTPAYMSPEQSRGELNRLGSRSDVYSLGATLFCLLTGKPPFEAPDVGAVLRAVQEGRFSSPRKLDPSIDPALEAVCLKAMALRSEDRYATCRALADDIERWMADEPVTARREPLLRRAQRWARRNRTAVASLAAAMLVALAGTGVVLAVQTRANERLVQANNELTRANVREKQRFDLATAAIKLFHGEVGNDLVLKAEQFRPLRDKLLGGALDFYGKLEELLKGQTDRASRDAMGDAYFELGELTSKIGDKPAALAAHRKGLAVRRMLDSGPATDDESKSDLASSLQAASFLLDQMGFSAEAITGFEEARDLLECLPLHGPRFNGRRGLLGMIYQGIGVALARMGKSAAAMTAYEKSLETLAPLTDVNQAGTVFPSILASTHLSIGNLQLKTGKPFAAMDSFQRVLAIQQKLADANPAVTVLQSQLASTHSNIGGLQLQIGRPAEALKSYRCAVAIQQKLADDNAAVTDFRSRLAVSYNNIGLLQSETGKPIEALESLKQALVIGQKLADDNPAVTQFRSRLAGTHNGIGNLHSRTGKPFEALESNRRAIAIQRKLADEHPAVIEFRSLLAGSYTNIGWLMMWDGKAAEAIAEFAREEAIRARLVHENPSVPDYRDSLANCQTNAATALLRVGRPDEARAMCGRALALRSVLVKDDPETPAYRRGLGESLLRCGQARRDEGDSAGAEADWRRADALLHGALPLNPEFTFIHACCHSSLSWAAGRPGSGVPVGEADAEAAKALELLRHAVELGYSDRASYSTETLLDSLRGRGDFQLLMLDLVFPKGAFAPSR